MRTGNRSTGRTTFMLIAALMEHERGMSVYVVAANEAHKALLQGEMRRVAARLGDYDVGINSIKFVTPNGLPNFDWEAGRLQGAQPNCRVFVDHFAIEEKFSWILRELHRFDEERS